MSAFSGKEGKNRMTPKPIINEILKLPSDVKSSYVDFPSACNKRISCIYCCHFIFNCLGKEEPLTNYPLIRNNGKCGFVTGARGIVCGVVCFRCYKIMSESSGFRFRCLRLGV